MKKSLVESRESVELLTYRNSFELWLESHSHLMAFIRTAAALSAAGLTVVVLYKVW
jgi:hypothetical protein